MREIQGKARTVRELLKGVKYSIDYYQREYKWHQKQILEMLDDLSGRFLEEFDESHERIKVKTYPHYFLGSIIISKKEDASYIVDGQQRLTSLTLLLMLLRNLQKNTEGIAHPVNLDECIFSEHYGEISFNLKVPDRLACMQAIYGQNLEGLDTSEMPESAQNLYARYLDLEGNLPEEIQGAALPYFADWLLENVHLVEITAYSDDDAYTIFETMNDRGLSLSPADMLKGYLLANISEAKRVPVSQLWRQRLLDLKAEDEDKEAESDFFKTWLRSQYAQKIRPRKRNAKAEDFDRIGTEFHRWLRDASTNIGLKGEGDFYNFIERDFRFYSKQYMRCLKASKTLTKGLEPVRYNAQMGFTLQHMLLLAPLSPGDPEPVIIRKLWLVSRYLEILLAWRVWNYRRIAYSNMQYAMFLVMRDIRGLEPGQLAQVLHQKLQEEKETFLQNSDYHNPEIGFAMHQQNGGQIHAMLARMTEYVETQSGLPSQYEEYTRKRGKNRFEIEHIWANHPERHEDEFPHPADFRTHRQRIGGLLLLPKSFNASYNDLPYAEKVDHYGKQNLLAGSLYGKTYELNPGFRAFRETSGLPFKAHTTFTRKDMDDRCALYRDLAAQIWNPNSLFEETT